MRLVARRAVAFLVAAGGLFYLAMNGAGYDIVTRQQFGFAVWGALGLGFAFGIVPRGRPDPALRIPLFAILGYLGFMVLSFAWTQSDERTTAELARVVMYGGVVTLAITGLNRHTFRAAAAGLTAAAMLVSCLSLASRLFPGSFPVDVVAITFQHPRLDYPLDYWNAVGCWGAMTVAMGLAWSAHARTTLFRALSLAMVPVAGLTIYLTFSRAGAIGAAVAVIAVLALSRNRWTALAHILVAGAGTALAIKVVSDHREIADAVSGAGAGAVILTLLVVGAACVATAIFTRTAKLDRVRVPVELASWTVAGTLALGLLVFVVAGHGVINRGYHAYKTQGEPNATGAARLKSAGSDRYDLWSAANDSFHAHPIKGSGPGTYEFVWSQDGRSTEFVRDAHSIYIENLAELGLPGLVLIVGALGGLFLVAFRGRKGLRRDGDLGASVAMTAAFAVFAVQAGVDWMWEETAVGVLAIGGIGIACAARSRRLNPAKRGTWFGGWVGLACLALLACATQVPGLVSTERVRASTDALRTRDFDRARELANQAITAEPWAASPYIQRALVEEAAGDLELAEGDVKRAISKEPTNWRHPLLLARIEVELKRPYLAVRYFRRGQHLRPRSPLFAPDSPIGHAVAQAATKAALDKQRATRGP